MRVISWTRPTRQQAISRLATPIAEEPRVASYIDEVGGIVFYSVPITIRLLYQFHFLKSIFTSETGRAAITSAIRKSEYGSECGQRTLMPETAPLWSTTFHSNYLSCGPVKKLATNSRCLRAYKFCERLFLSSNFAFQSNELYLDINLFLSVFLYNINCCQIHYYIPIHFFST